MTKPFNLADAKACHPMITSQKYPAVAVAERAGLLLVEINKTMIVYCDRLGNVLLPENAPHHAPTQLYMAPIGQLDGRDIYPGDMLTKRNGEQVPVPHSVPFNAEDWRAPYPTTRMTTQQLHTARYGNPSPPPPPSPYDDYEGEMTRFANAVIRHGIDNGYLVPAARLAEASAAADELRNAAASRELAIAQSAYSDGHYGRQNHLPYPSDDHFRDLIAQVKP